MTERGDRDFRISVEAGLFSALLMLGVELLWSHASFGSAMAKSLILGTLLFLVMLSLLRSRRARDGSP